MSDFLTFLVTPLLTKPDELQIRESQSGISMSVSAEDMGRVIGKNGVIIMAIRNLIRVYCATHNLPLLNFNLT